MWISELLKSEPTPIMIYSMRNSCANPQYTSSVSELWFLLAEKYIVLFVSLYLGRPLLEYYKYQCISITLCVNIPLKASKYES